MLSYDGTIGVRKIILAIFILKNDINMKKIPWNKIKWTDDEIGFLIVYNDRYTINEMAKILGKGVRTVKRKCYEELNLFKSDEAKYKHRSEADKKRGTDLSYEYVKAEAAKYNTKVEFWQQSPNAYRKANIMGWTDELCKHMVSRNFSLPQLILKSYLEQIFGEKCSYNNRNALKPYEIDCYFPRYKVGWEYNGILYHQNNKNDDLKRQIAEDNGIKLFYINENGKIKKYENFIKSVLKTQVSEINEILGDRKIDEGYIDTLVASIEYPNLLTQEEIKIVEGKSINQIKALNKNLYRRIVFYNLFEKYNIIDDRRKMHYFKTFEDYLEYIKKQNYSSFEEAYNKQHIHRMCKRFGKDVNIVRSLYNE